MQNQGGANIAPPCWTIPVYYPVELSLTIQPEVMQKWYKNLKGDNMLNLLVPIYGTKQVTGCYFDKAKGVLRKLGSEGSKADPCLFFNWITRYGSGMFLIWVDSKLFIAHKYVNVIKEEKEWLSKALYMEYVMMWMNCRKMLDAKWHSPRNAKDDHQYRPVLVQSIIHEFDDIEQEK
jgi:hypothetical protein